MRALFYTVGTLLLAAVVLGYLGGAIQWPAESQYQLAETFGQHGSEPGQLNEPTGIAVNAQSVFVADARNHRIQVFDRQGRFQRQFGSAVLQRPMNISLADGKLFAADYFADQVHIFSLDGEHLHSVAPTDGLNSPGGVAVFADGSLLVADTYAHRIVRFTLDGTVLASWGTAGSKGWKRVSFNYPTDVAVLADGGFVVADGYNDRIQRFDAAGKFIKAWGGPFALNIAGALPGWYRTPSAIAVNALGELATADFFNGRIQVTDLQGQVLTNSKKQAARSLFAAAWDSDGSLWTSNLADNRIEHFLRAK